MKRVRVLTAKPGFPAGTVMMMDDDTAKRWLSSGDGEETKDKLTREPEKAETATANPQ